MGTVKMKQEVTKQDANANLTPQHKGGALRENKGMGKGT